MGTVWLTADTHFGHAVAARHRGFTSVEAHDRQIIANMRRRVRQGDTLWVLGDVAFDGWADRLHPLDLVDCDKHVVFGNHDRGHPMHRNAHQHHRTYLSVFGSVQTVATIRHAGVEWFMSHFPYDGDHVGEERDTQWRLRDEGTPVFHGHTHSSERFTVSTLGTPQVHVGLDAWGLFPVSLHDAQAVWANNVGGRA